MGAFQLNKKAYVLLAAVSLSFSSFVRADADYTTLTYPVDSYDDPDTVFAPTGHGSAGASLLGNITVSSNWYASAEKFNLYKIDTTLKASGISSVTGAGYDYYGKIQLIKGITPPFTPNTSTPPSWAEIYFDSQTQSYILRTMASFGNQTPLGYETGTAVLADAKPLPKTPNPKPVHSGVVIPKPPKSTEKSPPIVATFASQAIIDVGNDITLSNNAAADVAFQLANPSASPSPLTTAVAEPTGFIGDTTSFNFTTYPVGVSPAAIPQSSFVSNASYKYNKIKMPVAVNSQLDAILALRGLTGPALSGLVPVYQIGSDGLLNTCDSGTASTTNLNVNDLAVVLGSEIDSLTQQTNPIPSTLNPSDEANVVGVGMLALAVTLDTEMGSGTLNFPATSISMDSLDATAKCLNYDGKLGELFAFIYRNSTFIDQASSQILPFDFQLTGRPLLTVSQVLAAQSGNQSVPSNTTLASLNPQVAAAESVRHQKQSSILQLQNQIIVEMHSKKPNQALITKNQATITGLQSDIQALDLQLLRYDLANGYLAGRQACLSYCSQRSAINSMANVKKLKDYAAAQTKWDNLQVQIMTSSNNIAEYETDLSITSSKAGKTVLNNDIAAEKARRAGLNTKAQAIAKWMASNSNSQLTSVTKRIGHLQAALNRATLLRTKFANSKQVWQIDAKILVYQRLISDYTSELQQQILTLAGVANIAGTPAIQNAQALVTSYLQSPYDLGEGEDLCTNYK
jgi:hypothetical protein